MHAYMFKDTMQEKKTQYTLISHFEQFCWTKEDIPIYAAHSPFNTI